MLLRPKNVCRGTAFPFKCVVDDDFSARLVAFRYDGLANRNRHVDLDCTTKLNRRIRPMHLVGNQLST